MIMMYFIKTQPRQLCVVKTDKLDLRSINRSKYSKLCFTKGFIKYKDSSNNIEDVLLIGQINQIGFNPSFKLCKKKSRYVKKKQKKKKKKKKKNTKKNKKN